ncbi:MAG: DMT family transporter [Clostridiales bacterium]|nr:DMT family transporter [Clostridiales bacterium]
METFFNSLESYPHLGEVLSVGSGFIWAVSVLLFRVSGRAVHPISLNFFKCGLSVLLLIPTGALLGLPLLPSLPAQDYGMMILSGFIGIALSDTLFFYCLNLLGASLTAIVDCLYSPFIIISSVLFIGERMSPHQVGGVALILIAVLSISVKKGEAVPPRQKLVLGVGLGVLAMLTQAVGVVMMKPLLDRSPLLWATLVRIGTAAVALGGFLALHPRARRLLRPLAAPSNWRAMIPASFLGAYVGLVAWMAGMKYTFASVAAPLNQLHTVFIFVLAAIFLREKVTPAKLVSLILAAVGATLVSWS